MIQAVRQKKRRKKRIVFVGLLIVLLAATGTTLHRLSLSLLDISRIIQLAAGKISDPQPAVLVENPSLRGTVYDRHLKELSVSYQLFTLYVHPVELIDRKKVARELALIINEDKQILADKLKNIQPVIELADDLDEQQVTDIESLALAGVYCKSREERYYPAHAAAGYLLGYTSKGTGLAGIEALYDSVLHPGDFRKDDLAEIDFKEEESLGRKAADIILTLDVELQKKIEQKLEQYRKQTGAARGMAIAMEPATGKVLAMVSQPGFDPNYFWQADDNKLKGQVFDKSYSTDLIRPFFLTTAAIYDAGINKSVLPATVRAPEYGLTELKLKEYWEKFGLTQPVPCKIYKDSLAGSATEYAGDGRERISGAQLAVGLSSLINGGTRVSPYFLERVYDHSQGASYSRDNEMTQRQRVVEPANGVHLRRELLSQPFFSTSEGFLFSNKAERVFIENSSSSYSIQEFLFAAVPRERPEIVLVMAVDHDGLLPLSPKMYRRKKNNETIARVGRDLLPVLAGACSFEPMAEIPLTKSEDNYKRFLISRRIDVAEQKQLYAEKEMSMPDVTGLSLRKGLQRINSLKLKISITGSGQIVAQEPAPGTPLADAGGCKLILESRI
jgi:cell division protein FtsI (penicillin-binding protein 3)